MTDQTQKMKVLVSGLEIEEAQKTALLERLEKEGATKEVFLAIKQSIDEAEDRLNAEDPDLQEIQQAKQEFEAEMTQIESDAVQLEKDLNSQLDQVDIDGVREQINSAK